MNLENICNELKKREISKIVKFNEPLKKYTSFRIGGPADIFCIPNTIKELKEVLSFSKEYNIPFWIIGNGTNVLILDKGIRGLVIKLSQGFKKIIFFDKIVKVGAGVSLIYLGKVALKRELSGLEFVCNIPGTIGGAIINNASFNGNYMSDIVQDVTFLNEENDLESASKSDLGFNYRRCNLKDKSAIILKVTLQLKEGKKEEIESKIRKNIRIRKASQPIDKLSAGSIFKNPLGYYAGELIEKVGAKGLSQGKAEVSCKHANFIINNGNATARDVLFLIEEIERRVKEAFNIELNREIQVLGEPSN